MSLMSPLERWTDILQYRQEQEDLRRQRENWPSVKQEGDEPPRRREDPRACLKPMVCRLCGYTAPIEYCPECLAFTMEKHQR